MPRRAHFGDKSWREAKGELLDEEGDTPSILPGEPEEEQTLLRLPSSKSGEWLNGGKGKFGTTKRLQTDIRELNKDHIGCQN